MLVFLYLIPIKCMIILFIVYCSEGAAGRRKKKGGKGVDSDEESIYEYVSIDWSQHCPTESTITCVERRLMMGSVCGRRYSSTLLCRVQSVTRHVI